jgi:hypothetical protein
MSLYSSFAFPTLCCVSLNSSFVFSISLKSAFNSFLLYWVRWAMSLYSSFAFPTFCCICLNSSTLPFISLSLYSLRVFTYGWLVVPSTFLSISLIIIKMSSITKMTLLGSSLMHMNSKFPNRRKILFSGLMNHATIRVMMLTDLSFRGLLTLS